ncbi:MAG: MEKHLA domain-containing protein [Planctomycetota bacterium]
MMTRLVMRRDDSAMNATGSESIESSSHQLPAGWVEHTQIMLDSYRHWTGRELIPRIGSAMEHAISLNQAAFVVVSHGTQADPILNYGNQTALSLWEMSVERLIQTPSRLTAEPMHRDERARLMERTTREGFVDDYQGIRISSTGRRFRIDQATVWNLMNSSGQLVGQAATFSEWRFLE